MEYLKVKNSECARSQVSNISVYKIPQLPSTICISFIWKSTNKEREILKCLELRESVAILLDL